jgi:hypothetical protein
MTKSYTKHLAQSASRLTDYLPELPDLPPRDSVDRSLARTLGVVSLAVGLTELFAQRRIHRLLGLRHSPENTAILCTLGTRECLHGLDLLTAPSDRLARGVWARVAGDLLDGAVLTAAAPRTRNPRGFLTACALVAPIVLADMLLAPRLARDEQ